MRYIIGLNKRGNWEIIPEPPKPGDLGSLRFIVADWLTREEAIRRIEKELRDREEQALRRALGIA